jgi:hypothetical protein
MPRDPRLAASPPLWHTLAVGRGGGRSPRLPRALPRGSDGARKNQKQLRQPSAITTANCACPDDGAARSQILRTIALPFGSRTYRAPTCRRSLASRLNPQLGAGIAVPSRHGRAHDTSRLPVWRGSGGSFGAVDQDDAAVPRLRRPFFDPLCRHAHLRPDAVGGLQLRLSNRERAFGDWRSDALAVAVAARQDTSPRAGERFGIRPRATFLTLISTWSLARSLSTSVQVSRPWPWCLEAQAPQKGSRWHLAEWLSGYARYDRGFQREAAQRAPRVRSRS